MLLYSRANCLDRASATILAVFQLPQSTMLPFKDGHHGICRHSPYHSIPRTTARLEPLGPQNLVLFLLLLFQSAGSLFQLHGSPCGPSITFARKWLVHPGYQLHSAHPQVTSRLPISTSSSSSNGSHASQQQSRHSADRTSRELLKRPGTFVSPQLGAAQQAPLPSTRRIFPASHYSVLDANLDVVQEPVICRGNRAIPLGAARS